MHGLFCIGTMPVFIYHLYHILCLEIKLSLKHCNNTCAHKFTDHNLKKKHVAIISKQQQLEHNNPQLATYFKLFYLYTYIWVDL